MLVAALAVIGIGIQLLFSIFIGWLFVLAAVLMGAAKGKSNKPDIRGTPDWQNVTLEELQHAAELLEKTRGVGSGLGKPTGACAAGCGIQLFALTGVLVAAALTYTDDWSLGTEQLILQHGATRASTFFVLVLDAVTLLAPTALFARVKAWEPPNLRMRMDQLMHIHALASSDPGLEFQPSLLVAKTTNGSVPTDCRLMIKFRDADKSFMGIQVQTTLNSVQGTKYPYTYCVLIARPEFKLLTKSQRVIEVPPRGGFSVGWFADNNAKKEAKFARYDGMVVEIKVENDVEIAVVRQPTSGQGYKTSTSGAGEVYEAAYRLARAVLNA